MHPRYYATNCFCNISKLSHTYHHAFSHRVEFGPAKDIQTSDQYIWHIEEDLARPGSLLFSWGSSLQTGSDTANMTRIAGSVDQKGYREGSPLQALFNNIIFFKQMGKLG